MPIRQQLFTLRRLRLNSQACHAAAATAGMMTRCLSTPARDAQAQASPPPLYAWNRANLPPGFADDSECLTRFSKSPSPDAEAPDARRRRIFILGVGNLGRLLASSLFQFQKTKTQLPRITLVVHRRELLEQWHVRPGIVMTRGGEREMSCFDVDVEWWTEERPQRGPVREPGGGLGISNLIVATKAKDALPQVDRFSRYLAPESTVAFTQNGMCPMWPPQGADYVARRWPEGDGPNWIACVTTHGVTSVKPFQSVHASQGSISVGSVLLNNRQQQQQQPGDSGGDSPAAYLINQLTHAPHLDGKAVSRGELWILQLEKLVVNSVINPLTAILHCKNGAIFADATLTRIIYQLIREASRVLQALVSNESISREILEGEEYDSNALLLERFSFDRLRAMVLDVGHKVRDNTSSMLQDVRAGRPTEIHAFNGWLVETAALLDPKLRLPTHQMIISLVEAGAALRRVEVEAAARREAASRASYSEI
ncbi:6-phosphogluconate dehydrogenase C-terminal domain-like protein [Apiospora arundinis]|uniref:6-phosphogluconate dehydrogenase C-terminal domain-like protein n=1 Tax=Apiospora arundinis TaxID=335852 RepID=A0ABR2HMK9_9PEZI